VTDIPQHNFAGQGALVLHRSEEAIRGVVERCARLGIRARGLRRDLTVDDLDGLDMVIVDIDTGHDGALPWTPGAAPVPLVGLVGSESPGRLGWALGQNVDAFLPLSALGNLFSALVIAHATFARRSDLMRERAETSLQRAGRLDVIRAVNALMAEGGDEALALKRLRTMAMVGQVSLEDAARRVLAQPDTRRSGAP